MNDSTFMMALRRKPDTGVTAQATAVKECSDDTDNIVSILQDICGALQASSIADFVVDGFGESPWPVDIETDLATILEQLPSGVAALRTNKPFVLDFYEQGIERKLDFVPHGESWRIECSSRTAWAPTPSYYTCSKATLDGMFSRFACDFVLLAKETIPTIVTNRWFVEWEAGAKAGRW